MHRGRYQLGQEIPLGVLTVNGSGTPSFPTNPPVMDIYSSSAQVINGKQLPVLDRSGVIGLFQYNLRLSNLFSAGTYNVVYRYLVGTYLGQEDDEFEIVAGGNGDGASIASFWYETPAADFLVRQMDSGLLLRGRNPRV